MSNFVLSFTTIPSRLKFIPDYINNIKNQTIQPSKVYVNIPYFSTRKQQNYEVPSNWNLGDNIIIVRCNDYGPATKLMGCIPYIKDPDTMIITLDDDIIYSNDTFETLVKCGLNYPDSVVCFSSLTSKHEPYVCNTKNEIENTDIYGIQGFGGVLYRRKFVSDDMFNYFAEDLYVDYDCFLSDDLTISKWLRIQKINIVKICTLKKITVIKQVDKQDPLHNENRQEVYLNCTKNIEILDDHTMPYFPDIIIYVMNLPEREDRKNHMKKMLTKIGANKNNIIFNSENTYNIPYIRKNDVKDRAKLIKDKKLTPKASNELNDAYIANALGQLDYINLISKSQHMGIIMEDDIVPIIHHRKIGALLQKSIEELPPDADMLYLEMCYENCKKINKVSENLYKLYRPSCTAAILYTVNGAKKILDLCMPVFEGIDIMIPNLIQEQKINAYGVPGMMFAQDEYYGTDAGRPNEKFQKIHRIRAPLCNTGNMGKKNFLLPDKGTTVDNTPLLNNNTPLLKYSNIAYLITVLLIIGSVIFYIFSKYKYRYIPLIISIIIFIIAIIVIIFTKK